MQRKSEMTLILPNFLTTNLTSNSHLESTFNQPGCETALFYIMISAQINTHAQQNHPKRGTILKYTYGQ